MTGDQLKEVRTRLNLTHVAMADHLGVAANTVARWERGERSIPEYLPLALEALEARLSKNKKKP